MANPNKVGLADALRQRELDEQERDSSDGQADWDDDAPDSPTKKSNVPTRKLGPRPGERAAPPPPATRPATKAQPAGASTAEKRPQSDLSGSEKAKGRACDSYEVDLAATEYGMCKCGFKKTEHVQGPAFRAAPRPIANVYHPETKAVEKTPVVVPTHVNESSEVASEAPDDTGDQNKPCDAFEVDLQAKEFGTCKCGFKKAQHSKSAQTAAPRRPSGISFASVQNAEKLAQEERQREQEELKRKAEEEKRSHEEFLERERKIRELEEQQNASETQQTEAAEAEPDLASESAQDEKKACDSFEIDLNAAEFGTCKCGFKKIDHSKTALFSKPLPKPVHAAPALSVPVVPKISGNRPPPAFATTAKTAPASVPVVPKVAEVRAPIHEEEKPPVVEEGTPIEEPTPVETAEATEPDAVEESEIPSTILDPPQLYRAKYDYEGQLAEDLTFVVDDEIEVEEILDADWMRGRIGERNGVFPSAFVEKVEQGEAEVVEDAPREAAADFTEEAEQQIDEQTPQEEETTAEPDAEQHHEEAVEEEIAHEESTTVAEPEVEPEHIDEPVQEAEPEPVQEAEPEPEVHPEPEPEPEVVQETVHEPVIEEPIVEEPLAVEEVVAAAVENEHGVPFTVRALFDFGGQASDDLSFKADEIIEVIAVVDADWWRGTVDGREGIFPASYVEREGAAAPSENIAEVAAEQEVAASADAVTHLGTVTALYDMEVQAEGDLGFRQGDVIQVLEVVSEEWYRGWLNGAEGLVPASYVTPLGETSE